MFICTVEDKDPIPEPSEVKDIQWMKKSELKKVLENTPEQIFMLQLGVLDYYLSYSERNHTSTETDACGEDKLDVALTARL